MKLFKYKQNKGFRFIKMYSTCLKRHITFKCASVDDSPEYSKGFTIVEAIIAIFILSVSVASMISLTADAAISARYANNEITANYLLQEAIDSIRNSRDTLAFQQKDTAGWNVFLSRYGFPNFRCFSTNGCYLKMESFDPQDILFNDIGTCSGTCPYLIYNNNTGATTFYSSYDVNGVTSVFRRTINMVINPTNPDEVKVTATVDWSNGTTSRTQSLEVSLLNWQN